MIDGQVTTRYAKSLLNLSIEKGLVEESFKDMHIILDAVEESKDLELLLKSPVVSSDKKQVILGKIFSGKLGPITDKFIEIITRKGREDILVGIAKAFLDQYRRFKGITRAEVTTAVALDENLRKAVLGLIIRSEDNEKVELIEKVDPEVIGGFIVRIGDRQVDATIQRQLEELKQSLVNNSYTKAF